MKKVLGIGNALVDIIIQLKDDKILTELELPKGSMQLVDNFRSVKVLNAIQHFDKTLASGGSAANTIAGIAALGIQSSFIGRIKNDKMGEVFKNDLLKNNIQAFLMYSDTPSGTAATFISHDFERTFATYLGASIELFSNDLKDEHFKGHDYFYIEGYLVQNHELIEKAVSMAKKHNQKIFLDLASYNVVEENIDFLKYIVKNYVDVLFANEEEAKAFTRKEPQEALNDLGKLCEIAIVKIGEKGSMIKSGGLITNIGTIETTVKDTNGAGDQYAAGFIYGLSNNYDLERCGKIGSIMSGTVIENYGARIKSEFWPKVKKMIGNI
jgi:sugar/nucleoside kinase (ribokinase family)